MDDHLINISSSRRNEDQDFVFEVAECRICQEEEDLFNMEAPCGCNGSVKYAHRKCVQRWCNEKGSTVCEICHQPYRSGYTATPRHVHLRNEWIVREVQEFAGDSLWGLNDEDYYEINSSTASSCRSAAITLLALLLLRHALALIAVYFGEDSTLLFMIFSLRAAGYLLPCYIIVITTMSILQCRRRQRQNEEAAATTPEVATMIRIGRPWGSLHLCMAEMNQ